MTITATPPPARTSSRWAAQVRANFREDYAEMRSWGLTHEQIATRLGIKKGSLLTRCRRAGVYIAEPSEQTVSMKLEELIASGRSFTSSDLPPLGIGPVGSALTRAIRLGRIRSTGTVPHPNGGHRLHVWISTQPMAVSA